MGEKKEEEEKESILDVIGYEGVLSYSSRWQRFQYEAKHVFSKLKSIIL